MGKHGRRHPVKDRREFLKTSLLAAGAVVIVRPAWARAATGGFPPGVIYTSENQGKWEGKAGSHAPKVEVKGGNASITTAHPMSAAHFIVRHTLVAPDGTVIGAKTFSPTDAKAVSSYELPAGSAGTFIATSFCNLHDFWLTEFKV
jgi:superoxide reductase